MSLEHYSYIVARVPESRAEEALAKIRDVPGVEATRVFGKNRLRISELFAEFSNEEAGVISELMVYQRNKVGLNQVELASQFGISQGTFSKIETTGQFISSNLGAIVQFLEVTPDELRHIVEESIARRKQIVEQSGFGIRRVLTHGSRKNETAFRLESDSLTQNCLEVTTNYGQVRLENISPISGSLGSIEEYFHQIRGIIIYAIIPFEVYEAHKQSKKEEALLMLDDESILPSE